MATSLSLVGVIWTVLSLSATLTACVGYFMPYWLSGDMLPSDGAMLQLRQTSFGTYRRCGYSFVATKTSTTATDEGAHGRRLVSECGRYRSLWDIPSVWWQATTVLVGAGCCVAIVVASAGLLCCCVSDAMSRPLGVTACLLQLTAGEPPSRRYRRADRTYRVSASVAISCKDCNAAACRWSSFGWVRISRRRWRDHYGMPDRLTVTVPDLTPLQTYTAR